MMPLFRGRNGQVKPRSDDDEPSTRKIDQTDEAAPLYPTTEPDKSSVPIANSDEPKTRVLYRRPSDENAKPIVDDVMSDPVVGWLVVVDGPGKGHVLPLGYGMNSIGRGNTERICLNFGDEEVSRHQHAIVTYDPRGRKFYVQQGGGKNLTYLADKPLLVPVELQGSEDILLGQTTLRFIPLCGEEFDWQTHC